MATTYTRPIQTPTRILREGRLSTEYTVVRAARTREWVAVGSVREDDQPRLSPAWLLVGSGATEPDAIADLRRRLQVEAAKRAASV